MDKIIYLIAIMVLACGLYIIMTSENYVRKIFGLGIFQSSVLIFYIALSKVSSGIVPIDICHTKNLCDYPYTSPLPHVLMLTAIVVGFATMSVALALTIEIKREFKTILECETSNIIRENNDAN